MVAVWLMLWFVCLLTWHWCVLAKCWNGLIWFLVWGLPQRKRKGRVFILYSAFLHQGTYKALRHGSHSFTCKQHHACFSFMSVHQMAPPQQLRQQKSNCSLLLIYWPWKDERLSWPGWLTSSGWFTHLSGHPSTTGPDVGSGSTHRKGDLPQSQSVGLGNFQLLPCHSWPSQQWLSSCCFTCPLFPSYCTSGQVVPKGFLQAGQISDTVWTTVSDCWAAMLELKNFSDTESLPRYIKTYNSHKVSH